MKKHRTAALGLWFCALRLFNDTFYCSFGHEKRSWTFAAVSPRGVKIDLSE